MGRITHRVESVFALDHLVVLMTSSSRDELTLLHHLESRALSGKQSFIICILHHLVCLSRKTSPITLT